MQKYRQEYKSSYKLISFDMFQTLVDLGTRKSVIMKSILKEHYTDITADKLWRDADEYVYSYFQRAGISGEPFKTVLEVFTDCYEYLFPKYGIKMAPADGAMILSTMHNDADLYPESLGVLERISRTYKTCLISDTDNVMIEKLIKYFSFDKIYTSENYREYKNNKNGTLFKSAIKDFGIRPEEMLHIGDGYNDIAGAKAVNAKTVWVNRNGREWEHSLRPDNIVRNLTEIKLT